MAEFKYSDKQKLASKEWLNPSISEIFYDGGARCGKTWLICHAFICNAINYPNSRYLIARYRYNHMITTVWMQTLLPLLQLHFPQKKMYEIDNKYTIINFWNGSSIWGTGLDEDERVEKIMGSEFNRIFLNELSQMSFATFQKLKTRLSLKAYNSLGESIKNLIVGDTNPRNRHHWAYQYFILNKDPSTKQALSDNIVNRKVRRHWTPYDNPFLSKEYIENLEGLTGVERDRLLKGEWVDQEGLVYKNYEDAICEPFKLPLHWNISTATDFGFTNPFVNLWFADDKANETFYLFLEHYQAETTINEHCKIIKLLEKEHNINKPLFRVADHDAGDRQIMNDNGLTTIAANKDISIGIQELDDLLTSKRGYKLKIFRTCVNTIEEFSGYSWGEKKEVRNADEKPLKSNDHAMDSCRYWAREVTKNLKSSNNRVTANRKI